jgi:hypothetical protein
MQLIKTLIKKYNLKFNQFNQKKIINGFSQKNDYKRNV